MIKKIWNSNYIANTNPHKDKTYFIMSGILLALFLCFFIPLVNSYIFIADGWTQYNSELMKNGKVIYKDFFMYLPPIHGMINHLLSLISDNNLFIPRIFGLCERLLIIFFAYVILCKFFKPSIVVITLLSSAILSYSHPQDTIYHYMHDALLFQIVALFMFLKFLESTARKNLYLFTCGVFTGLSFLTKQVMIIYLIIWPVLLIISNIYSRKRQATSLFALIGGLIIPIFITAISLEYYDALAPALIQIFKSGEAKGPLLKILFGYFPSVFRLKHILFFIIIVETIILGLINKNEVEQIIDLPVIRKIRKKKLICYLLLISIILLMASIFLIKIKTLAIIAFIFTLIIIFYLISLVFNNENLTIFFLTAICLLGIICVWLMPFDILHSIYPRIHAPAEIIINVTFIILLFLSISGFFIILFKKQLFGINLWILIAWCFSYMLTHGFSVSYFEIHSALFPVGLVFCIILSINLPFFSLIKSIFISFSFFIYISVFLAKVDKPFVWWGWNEPPVHKYERVYLENNLKGFKVSARTNYILTKITNDIKNNISNEGTLYTFPYCPIFHILSGKFSSTFSPVHFFDVCPDFVVKEDFKLLQKNPPDMIVYEILTCDMSVNKKAEEEAWTLYEYLFRNGERAAARDIKELIENWVEDGTYVVVSQIENLSVLKRRM